jgi:hypothetical protein
MEEVQTTHSRLRIDLVRRFAEVLMLWPDVVDAAELLRSKGLPPPQRM